MKIGCVIPAAGFSRRFGAADKLTAEVGGTAMIRRVCEAVVASRAEECRVVVRPGADGVTKALMGLPVSFVRNPLADTGMASSIAAGVSALGGTVAGAFVLPADMPGMTSEFLNELIERFESEGGDKLVVPVTANGDQRNPVLWPSAYFQELCKLAGEGGAKGLLRALPEGAVVKVAAPDARLFADVDTPRDLAGLQDGPAH